MSSSPSQKGRPASRIERSTTIDQNPTIEHMFDCSFAQADGPRESIGCSQQPVPTGTRSRSASAEVVVRNALRQRVLADIHGAKGTVDEFWVPQSNERADLAVIGRWMDGFEIKTERDTLRRLPRQAVAYGRLFDRCTVVVAAKHSEGAEQIVPDWWGIKTMLVHGSVCFTTVRGARTNPGLDPEVLVRLLWRDEVMAALIDLGLDPDRRAPRASLWRQFLAATTLSQLRRVVRRSVLGRDPAYAQTVVRRVSSS